MGSMVPLAPVKRLGAARENGMSAAAVSVAAIAGITLIIAVLDDWVPVLGLSVLYLFVVLPVSIVWGMRFGIAAAVASMLTFNFFLLPPVHSFRISASGTWVALGVFVVVAVVVSELSARSQRRTQALVEAETLRRSDALKTALLRTVSHDLRSPLMAILTSSSALEKHDLELTPEDRAELLETISGEAGRLDRLVANLLDLSRLQAGVAEPHAELWPLDDLIGQALGELGADAARVAVTLPDHSVAVRVDPAQIERVLANLIENALKYSSPPDTVEVLVAATGGEAIVRVTDRGAGARCGRARAHLRAVPARIRIGRRSRRGPRPRHRARVRRGQRRPRLGREARRRGSRVRAEPARRGPGRGALVSSAALRVLVVDDEPQILSALRTSLRAAGYEVATADTAKGALAEAAMRPPDAVILDLVLPDGSGTDVCRELRTWTSVPVIVLSAVGDEAEKVAALDAGADDYVTKPVGIDELLARLRAGLRRVTPSGDPVLTIGDLVVDLQKQSVAMAGEPVHLTPHQFDILRVLAKNEGKLLTHRAILREVWGPGYGSESNLLHVHISQLRRKIEPDPARPRYILTAAGAGYRLVDPGNVA